MNLSDLTKLLETANELANTVARMRINIMTPEEKANELSTIRESSRNRFAWEDHRDGLDSTHCPYCGNLNDYCICGHVAIRGGTQEASA